MIVDALLTIDQLNQFLYHNIRKPNKKQQGMMLRIQLENYRNKYRMAFYLTLRTLITSIIFECDSFKANDWIVSRALHSSIVMCELVDMAPDKLAFLSSRNSRGSTGGLFGTETSSSPALVDASNSMSLKIMHEIINQYERSASRRSQLLNSASILLGFRQKMDSEVQGQG